jgi:hypothetical protein
LEEGWKKLGGAFMAGGGVGGGGVGETDEGSVATVGDEDKKENVEEKKDEESEVYFPRSWNEMTDVRTRRDLEIFSGRCEVVSVLF